MSFVVDQVRRIDAELDKLQPTPAASSPSSDAASSSEVTDDSTAVRVDSVIRLPTSPHIVGLQATARALSTASSAQRLLSPGALLSVLARAEGPGSATEAETKTQQEIAYERELRWLIIGKATAQVYGVILKNFLDQTIPLANDIWYWEEVLSSYRYTGLYSLQTSPIRAWAFTKDVYRDVRRRIESLHQSVRSEGGGAFSAPPEDEQTPSLTERWSQFYNLVVQSMTERSLSTLHRRVASPFALSRIDARRKQKSLIKFRELSASGLGILIDEGLKFDFDDEASTASKRGSVSNPSNASKEEWKAVLEKSIALMDSVLRNVNTLEIGVPEFEDVVFTGVEDDSDIVTGEANNLAREDIQLMKLQHILRDHLPEQHATSIKLIKEYGRPSKLIRYWLPATALLLSSTTILRIVVRRKAAIMSWVREAGQTAVDFWINWVVGPVKKIIGTIRHDKDSEVAIMSKRSLEGDRASLERMVVDFAVDNPNGSSGARLSDVEIADLRAKVKEGDLTPVLKAYEQDLRKPFWGTVRGELIRALLIQIQKTKVDVEVAIGGIDSLLKSQELVFGFVGLTPGVLVCIATARYLSGVFGSRKGLDNGKRQNKIVRSVRNIDRLLCASTPSQNGMLSYKEHGLLLCETQVLRETAMRLLPTDTHREFLEELDDLLDIRVGVKAQLRVLERIRWAYGKWIK